eukprot:TRINITY_DN7100_c0_g1_i1.p1 TRINITY_DN7100_c0_g1~~TRINITY_DN7100_c0_g1_i1.p1  ORF type:complete len:719 (-),score=145.16 TRINITY_DN7100_c0_g1_i1:94-2250(-)
MQRFNVKTFCLLTNKRALAFNTPLRVSYIRQYAPNFSSYGHTRSFSTARREDTNEGLTSQEAKIKAMMRHLKQDNVENVEKEYAHLLQALNTPREVPSDVSDFMKGKMGFMNEGENEGQGEEQMGEEEYDSKAEESMEDMFKDNGMMDDPVVKILSKEAKRISSLSPQGNATLKKIFCCYDLKEAIENLHFSCIKRISDIFEDDQKGDESVVHFAIRIGSFKGFSGLLSRGYDVHAKTIDGESLLHYACLPRIEEQKGQEIDEKIDEKDEKPNALEDVEFGAMFFNIEDSLKAVSILLKYNLDVNATNSNGDTPLTVAISRGPEAIKLVELLLRYGANPNIKTRHGTPLEIAMEGGYFEIMDVLLKYKANVIIDDFSVFHLAAVAGHPKILSTLLKHDLPDVAFQDPRGNTPLHLVTESSAKGAHKRKCVRLLVKAAGENMLDARNFAGNTPLHMAAMNGDLDVVEALLECGANPEILDNQNRATPLMVAASGGFPEVVKVLYKAKVAVGDEAGIGVINESGHNALHFACASSNLDCLKVLAIDANGQVSPSIHLLSKEGHTPLCIAMSRGRKEIGEFLLDTCGVKVDQPDSIDNTPLYYASLEGFNDCSQLLLDHGADPNFKNVHGETPLMIVFKKLTYNSKFHECAVSLIKGGAEVNIADNFGQTPLHIAAKEGLVNWIKLLVSRGADIKLKDEDGKTPYDLSISSGNIKCANFLK